MGSESIAPMVETSKNRLEIYKWILDLAIVFIAVADVGVAIAVIACDAYRGSCGVNFSWEVSKIYRC